MIYTLLFLAFLAFSAYALIAHYQRTDATKPVAARVWASYTAAATLLGAAVTAWLHSGAPAP